MGDTRKEVLHDQRLRSLFAEKLLGRAAEFTLFAVLAGYSAPDDVVAAGFADTTCASNANQCELNRAGWIDL